MKHFTILASICLLSWQSNAQITTYPYSEDFEGGAGGWAASGTVWQLGTPSAATINSANSGTNSWATNLTGNYPNGADAIVTSPVFDFTAVLNPLMQLSIWWNSELSWDGTVLQSSIDGGASWQNVGNLGDPDWFTDGTINGTPGGQQIGWSGTGNGSWITTTHDLTGLGGNTSVTLRFAFGSDGSVNSFDGFAFDDINIINLTCPQPVSIVMDSTDLTTGSFSWTPTGTETEWEIEYGPIGFTPGTGTTVLTSPNPWYTVTGLTSNSFYEVYVSAACALNDTSFQTGPTIFNTYNQPLYMEADTECPLGGFIDISSTGLDLGLTDDGEVGIDPLPFDILFQGVLMTNATIGNNGGVQLGTTTANIGYGGNFNTLGDGTLFPWGDDLDEETGNVYAEQIGTSPNSVLVVQWDNICNFSGNASSPTVTFQVQIDEATNEIYYVYDDVVFGGSNIADDYADNASIGLSGPNQDITTSDNDPVYLQNNSCAHYYYTDCPKPLNFSVSYTTSTEGAITWSAGLSGEANWTVIYGLEGFDPTQTGTTVQTTSPVLIMPGLDDITTYDVYIYADCSPSIQSFGATGSFTTLPNCANPSGITATSAIDTLMSVWSWTENVGYPSTGFGVQYGWTGFTPGNGTTVWVDNNFTDTTADISLIGGGVYEVYIQAVCGTDSSAWTGPISFTMPLTNDSTCFAEELAVDGTLYTFNNAGATIDANEISIAPPATGFQTQTGWGNSNLNSSVWYTFTAPASGNIRANAAGINFDGQLAAYEVTDCNDFATYTLLGANDDGPNNVNPPLLNLCGLTPGAQYYLMYDPFSTTATGTYNLTLTDVDITAGTDNGLTDICLGDTVNLFTNISGNDAGGVWYENIPTANFSDSIFVSAGLASQEFGFTYVVTDGCAADTIATSVEIYAPSSAGSDGTITACLNQPIDLLDGLGGNVDLGGNWYDPTNTLIASTAINSGPVPGQFNYDYITGNGVCPDDSANIIVDVDFNCDFLNLQDLFFNGMDIHPNPTTGMIYISNDGSTEVFNIELTDLNGKVIATQSGAVNGTETTEVDLSNLETGIYLIHVFNDNAEKTFRVVKQ
ncbi:MAG: hypothetical protein ACJASQ_000612 [Crocinitomicaceae bacterium]|jgi:hypothetical protein